MDPRESETRRRIAEQELYVDTGPGLEALDEARIRGKELVHDFNTTTPRQGVERDRLLRDLLGSVGTGVWIEPPLRVMYGSQVHLGDHVYINVNVTLIDDGEIHIGDRVMIAPNVTLCTTGHPVHPDLRRDGTQFSAPVRIEDDVWICTGATILPGVTIGAGSVIAAGAVVNAHVPPMTIVGGTPARILRPITDADRQWTYHPPRTLS